MEHFNKMVNGIPFTDDKSVVGKWEFYTLVENIDEFKPSTPDVFEGNGFFEIYFLPNGQKYWIYEGWTAGILFTHLGGEEPIVEHRYEVREFDNEKYIFIDMNEEIPLFCVLKQVSNREYKLMEIGRRDKIDMPFICDKSVVGLWKSVAYVDKISSFVQTNTTEELWLKSVFFYEDGRVERQYGDDVWCDNWTSGYLIDKVKSTASKYHITSIGEDKYLFLEWKMGNYVYGGQKPYYYVFQRA